MKRKIALLTVCLLIMMLLADCSFREYVPEIDQDEFGYNLDDYFETEEKALIRAMIQFGADPLYEGESNLDDRGHESSVTTRYYTFEETIMGIRYKTVIAFKNYPDSRRFIFSEYRRTAILDHYPEGEEAEGLQALYDNLIQKFGEPTRKNNIKDDNEVFGKYMVAKGASWDDAHVSFELGYDIAEKTTHLVFEGQNSPYYRDYMD